jgi:MoxR-like ATPase
MENNENKDNVHNQEGSEEMNQQIENGFTQDTHSINFDIVDKLVNGLKNESGKIIVGQDEVLELMLVCILCDGHILLEGVPGVAKTLSAKVLAKSIDADFSRIQFTPDLMPADIIGTSVFNMKESTFNFKKGPIFSNIVLIDEINRAPAKTQSALFEVMEERQISYDGEVYAAQYPFLIIATQNPVEQEGTYRLPEAQLDRFLMKISIDYPDFDEEVKILHRFKSSIGKTDISNVNISITKDDLKTLQDNIAKIYIQDNIIDYIVKIVQETRNHGKVYLGASPRASLSILKASKAMALLSGRHFVIPDDVQIVAPHILNHRIIVTPEADMSGLDSYDIIKDILKETEVPR